MSDLSIHIVEGLYFFKIKFLLVVYLAVRIKYSKKHGFYVYRKYYVSLYYVSK